ncbi:MAG TPA: DUF1365 domain-containing protein [Marinagarivorans sp.]
MSSNQPLASRVYEGWVRHRRFSPKKHAFRYRVFMMYLDLEELDQVIALSRWWSRETWGLAVFKRKDFAGDPRTSLDCSVRDLVESRLGCRPEGPIRVLANLRYFGYYTNPLTTYYCFNKAGTAVEFIVAEVTNTPWGERHAYVLNVNGKNKFQSEFEKCFHVSPFNPMNMHYRWYSNAPCEHLSIHLENWVVDDGAGRGSKGEERKVMDATLMLTAEPVTRKKLNRLLIEYPLMTVKVISAIYWQALRLAIKRVPFYGHPDSRTT